MGKAGIRLFQTRDHACGYWPQRVARDLLLDPHDPELPLLYAQALALGFRRSGGHLYRPRCPTCTACVPLRVPVAQFRANRTQRRCLSRNAEVSFAPVEARRTTERFGLYRRYLRARHAGGGMEQGGPDEFDAFLLSDWSPTRFFELREHGRLLGIAVTDVLPEALSAVYTFFEPGLEARGLGTLAALRQIEWARLTGRRHLYLGFWIAGHPKMDYKATFRPAEVLLGGHWTTLERPRRMAESERCERPPSSPAPLPSPAPVR